MYLSCDRSIDQCPFGYGNEVYFEYLAGNEDRPIVDSITGIIKNMLVTLNGSKYILVTMISRNNCAVSSDQVFCVNRIIKDSFGVFDTKVDK